MAGFAGKNPPNNQERIATPNEIQLVRGDVLVPSDPSDTKIDCAFYVVSSSLFFVKLLGLIRAWLG